MKSIKVKNSRVMNKVSRVSLVLMGAFAAILFVVAQSRQAEPGNSIEITAPKKILQFTSGGQIVGFAADGVYVASGSHALRVEFVNAHQAIPVSAVAPTETQGSTPLSQVTYPNLWDGVTLTYDAPGRAVVRSTYRLDAYAKAENIRLRYNAPVSVRNDGSLRVGFQTGAVQESAPQAWQERGGKRVPVQVAFAPRGKDEITFAVGKYDRSEPLFIDPTLTWNTFLGGSGNDGGGTLGVTVDGTGNVYVAGFSDTTWGSPVRGFSGGVNDAFVAKLDSSGNLIWNTFLGGSGGDTPNPVAVDGSGNVYVAGGSSATWGSPVRAFIGGIGSQVAFAAKLDSNGNLIWNTFLGSGNDPGQGLTVDGSGNVYVSGQSRETWGSPIRAFSGGVNDAFAAKLDSSGNLIWNTFLGGSANDGGFGLSVEAGGNVYVAGFSETTWGSPIRAFSGGVADAFAAKLDSSGNLIWNTFLGGSGLDGGIDAEHAGIQPRVCLDAILRLPAAQSERPARHRLHWIRLLADEAQSIQRQLRQCRDGQGFHYFDRIPAAIRSLTMSTTPCSCRGAGAIFTSSNRISLPMSPQKTSGT